MTSPLPRKPRTTARPTPAAGTRFSLACLAAALAAGAAGAQPPARAAARQPVAAQPPVGPPRVPQPPVGPSAQDINQITTLPDRSVIFALRDDAQTERYTLETLRQAEIERVREEEKKRLQEVAALRAKGEPVPPNLLVAKDPVKEAFTRYPRDRGFPRIEVPGAGQEYVAKTGSYAPSDCRFDARYVVHRRLHFEELNSERYGWDLGYIQPFVSAAFFFRDVLLLPNSLASGFAYGFWDTNAGKCLPGSPTPYLLYPPGLTITGTAAEAAIITGAAFAFP